MAGYLSGLSLYRSFSRGGSYKTNIKNYFMRRVCKIVPLFYILFGIFVFTAGKQAEGCKGRRVWGALLFFNNLMIAGADDPPCYGISWYLSIQMQLYILTPFFVYAYHKSKKLGHLLTLGAIGICLAIR